MHLMERATAIAMLCAAMAGCAENPEPRTGSRAPAETAIDLDETAIDLDEAASDEDLLESGRGIAETHCAACHAIGSDDLSPRTDAPPLRTVLETYDPEALATDFRERLRVGHADMPDYDFGPIGTDGLLAYIQSITADPTER